MLRAATFGLALAALSAANPARAWAEEKIALVIGNSDYRKVARLTNPANDAADMAASLRRLGFTVKHLTNLDFDGFRKALIGFGNAARTADKAAIFFAGHGVEIDGKNWLIPVDAEIKSELDVYAEAINLETLIDISVMPKVIGLVILDACRNDPFAATNLAAGRSLSTAKDPAQARNSAKKRSRAARAEPARPVPEPNDLAETSARGLAPVEVNDNVLVAFAAAAGTTASDGNGRNSPYSGSLLRHVETPGLEINYLFRNVHDDVVRETRTQEPAVYGTLSKEEIYLKGDALIAAAGAEAEAERVAWTFVRSTNEVATLRRFSELFPASTHAAEIRDRIAQLEDAEKFAWTIVERQKSVAAYRAFLDLYPYSEHVESARVTLASLETSSLGQPDEQAVDLTKPPASTFQLASSSPEATTRDSDSIEKAWDVLKESRDQNMVGRFAEKYPSLRHSRLPAGSDLALRPVSSTEWMLRTAQDDDVNRCFAGNSPSCVTAVDKYPDFVQLRFQLCRTAGHPNGCMQDAVEDARQRGYLVSAYTRSEKEKARNRAYRQTLARVQENVGNIISNIVGNVVSNVVSNSVSNAASAAASAAASSAAGSAAASAAAAVAVRPSSGISVISARPVMLPAAPRAAPPPVLAGTGRWDVRLGGIKAGGQAAPPVRTAIPSGVKSGLPGVAVTAPAPITVPAAVGGAASSAASSAAGKAASGAAGTAASTAAGNAASNAAGKTAATAAGNAASRAASNAAGKAASGAAANAAGTAASNAASRSASNAAGRAASTAASNAAGRAASNAASNAAGRAASNAASKAASNAAANAAGRAAANAASKAAAAAANAASNIRIPSDIRLKQDITGIGYTDSGLRLYRYRYIGDDTFYVGVMAQEVAQQVPAAVSQSDDGYLEVDYGLLGLEIRDYPDWTRRHPPGPTN